MPHTQLLTRGPLVPHMQLLTRIGLVSHWPRGLRTRSSDGASSDGGTHAIVAGPLAPRSGTTLAVVDADHGPPVPHTDLLTGIEFNSCWPGVRGPVMLPHADPLSSRAERSVDSDYLTNSTFRTIH